MLEKLEGIEKLKHIMALLREPEKGCPWDIEQSMQSLIKHTLEEAYEVADAIYRQNPEHICEELGDLLFQIVFYAQIGQEQGYFSFDDVANSICEKLIRRHPHVFADNVSKLSAEDVAVQWQAIKNAEKLAKPAAKSPHSVFDSLSNGKPALMRANDLQKACANVGFDWDQVTLVLDKVKEEIEELHVEMQHGDSNTQKQEEEYGDLLFAMVNLGRHLDIDPDTALQKANLKFERRFRRVEELADNQQTALKTLSLESMEKLWITVKKLESDDEL